MDEEIVKLNKAIDSLGEEKKKFDIALYYTHNDNDKAKNMLSGIYKDLYVIKITFSASTIQGAILVFFNIPYSSVVNSFIVVSHSYSLNNLKTRMEWRMFEENINSVYQAGNNDNELSSKVREEISNAFTIKIGTDQRVNELKKFLEHDDQIAINRMLKKLISDKLGLQNLNISVDFEPISSLDMELYSISGKKIELSEDNKKNKEEPAEKREKNPEDEGKLEAKDVQLVLDGTLILSPIKGKSISQIKNGDKLMINLNGVNSKAIAVAKAFKRYKDGIILPISGRVVSLKHLSAGGYKIYCIIAKGIYVKIEEEEDNLKIETDEEFQEIEKSGNNMLKNPATTIVLGVVVLVLVAVIITFAII